MLSIKGMKGNYQKHAIVFNSYKVVDLIRRGTEGNAENVLLTTKLEKHLRNANFIRQTPTGTHVSSTNSRQKQLRFDVDSTKYRHKSTTKFSEGISCFEWNSTDFNASLSRFEKITNLKIALEFP